MATTVEVVAKWKSKRGYESDSAKVDRPDSLREAVKMFGEERVFDLFLRCFIIQAQSDIRREHNSRKRAGFAPWRKGLGG